MRTLSDEMLLEALHKAKEVEVEEDFLRLIKGEVKRRGLIIENNKIKIEA
jgi:hypothetical protein